MGEAPGLPGDLVRWIEGATEARLVSAVRIAGGGRKQGWFVDIVRDGEVEPLFLRWDPMAPDDPWEVRREAAFYAAFAGTGLPIARLVSLHPTLQAMLLTRLSGTARFSALRDPVERIAVASDFMARLAELHRLDPRALGLLDESEGATTVPDLVRRQLAECEGIIEARGGPVEPILRLALDWLAANIPAYDGPVVVVQGDTGPGNFLFADGKVTAIVDWELAHLGDPMDDLAWVSLRAVQDPFTDLRDRFAEYEQASGHGLAPDRIRYYRVLAEARILVMSHGLGAVVALDPDAGDDGGGYDPGARLIFGQLHRRLCAEALAEVMGIPLDPPVVHPPRPATEDDELFAAVLGQLRDVVTPRITDAFASQRVKGLARAIKYLATSARSDGLDGADEAADLREVLGASGDDLGVLRSSFADAVAARTVDPAAAVRVVHRRLMRRNELLRGASGALADRHYDPLG